MAFPLFRNCRRFTSKHLNSSRLRGMDLGKVVGALEAIAPLDLAEKWDNVGLLVEPSLPHSVQRIFLTNDLTECVLQESIDAGANLIVSYHPPIFRPIKRVTSGTWKERLIIKALENRIAIYSPHTSSDAVQNGVNDWLASGIGEILHVGPIKKSMKATPGGLLFCEAKHKEAYEKMTEKSSFCETISAGEFGVIAHCKAGISETFDNLEIYGIARDGVKFIPTTEQPVNAAGAGRLCNLKSSLPLKTVIKNLKQHIGLSHLRLAIASGKSLDDEIQTVALCAGSGSSVVSGCKADLFLTGEMSHHEVLEATQNGIHVILCEHSNSERGYLKVLREQIKEKLKCDDVIISVSKCDKDPLEVV